MRWKVCRIRSRRRRAHSNSPLSTVSPPNITRKPRPALSGLVTSPGRRGGWLARLGNMLYLSICGDNVGDRLGRVRYLVFYLLCGMAAGGAQAWTSPHSGLPMVGASGAIAGVSGAYFL